MQKHSQQSPKDSSSSTDARLKPSSSILFVCLGNICRSPAAEGVMRALATKANLHESLVIESAGTGGYHDGKLPDSRMRAAAEKRGYHWTVVQKLLSGKTLVGSTLSWPWTAKTCEPSIP